MPIASSTSGRREMISCGGADPSVGTEEVGVTGRVNGSLFGAVLDAGERPELAMHLAEIFGWDLIFTRTRAGRHFPRGRRKENACDWRGCFLWPHSRRGVQQRLASLPRGPVHGPNGAPAYYTPEGKSMKKAFLHSPLKFAAVITSHFSEHRFHPILKDTGHTWELITPRPPARPCKPSAMVV